LAHGPESGKEAGFIKGLDLNIDNLSVLFVLKKSGDSFESPLFTLLSTALFQR
jgi:hypothetical protein